MKFQPLMPWWIILPLAILSLAALGWHIWKIRREGKPTIFKWARRALLVVLLILISFGPSIPGGTASPGIANLEVLFAVDTTASMGAQDYVDGKLRMEGVKQDLLALGSRLQGANIALVTFDSKVNTIMPFTADHATFTSSVETLHQEIQGTSKGSAIDKPIKLITQELKTSKSNYPDRSRLLFYISDGEQTNDKPVESFKAIEEYLDGGSVLGYGSSDGAKMVKYTGLEKPGSEASKNPAFVNALDPATKTFVPAISKIDEKNLNKIAAELKLDYHNRNKGGSIDEVYKSSKAEFLTAEGKKIKYYLNLYWLFAIPFAALLFWEWKEIFKLVIQLRRDQKGKNVTQAV